MEEKLKSLFLKLQDVFHPERGLENSATKERAKNFPAASSDLAISQEDKCVFKSLLFYVKETVLKPWSDNQAEFLVLTCFEDDDLNQVNYMSVLSSFGFARGDKTSLEMVKKYLKNHCDQFYPNAPLLMNNLGVMFNENALFEESEECFNMAKVYCQHQDNIKNAVITLNQAVLKKTLGKYKEAANLASTAASLCHDISMRATNYAQLPVKLLGRVADMLKEFGNHQMLKKILRTAVYFDIPGADKAVAAVLSRQLMKIQLEGMEKKIEAKEVKDFISHLLAFLTKPDASKMSMNAELIRIVIQAAKICRIAGQCQEACNLLKKLQSIFLLVHGENSFLYGSLLYQMGCFLHGSGRFGDAETALKQAEVILFCHCGENHYSVALCRSVLGSCILLKSNAKDAFEYLNKALTVFKKLNPIHPEVGEITLKFAFFYAEERNFQQAQETLQEAETIFKLSCGEASCKTASAYFQVGMILQRFKQFRLSAVEKVQKGIEMMVNLGMNLNHPDVMFWSSFLGVLKQSLGLVKEAEKCFTDVQNRVPFCDDLGSKETQILTTEDWFLHYRDRADEWRSSSSFLKAQVVSLANLVHIEGGDKRIQYLDKLVCCLEDEEIEKIHVRDFAGQDVFLFTHKIPSFNRLAVLIVHVFDSLPDRLGADAGTNSKMFLSSSAEKSPFTLFLSIQGRGLDMKEINCMTSSFRESVKMLFLQPKFRKGFAEGKDLYLELPTPADISSFSSHFDCLPLLVELELTKSKEQEQCDEFDFLTSWQSSVDSATHSVPHVSYFSFRCVNQREMEFVFDHLSQNLGQKLALNGFQEDMNVISDVSPEENVASFIFQESQSLFLTIVAGNLSVIVKCCSFKESGAHCLCSSIRNALTVTIESLLDIVSVNLETSMLLDCEGIGSVLGHEEYLSGNCSQSVNCNPVSSGLTLESVNSTIPDQESKTDFTSTRKLRVTLLSSEWRSIKGGLSTINRELAIQLAKHPSVEVSVYLPRCSEEDKRVAASHSVHLIKAKEMPGYDPVDWLSFLPEHHAVDCVIGHGAVLGRQVQLIKRNHSCKWVQVVHTSPEEIGMYKGYGEHISKGEEKHQAEVELCKLVDQVVAVGPKLFEAYSGYLRACGKDQKVFSLTPGVFSEFADIRHANEERRNFKVLVFGCEDDAEFKVKGYDIAAHAVAQLKDRCYTLVFVSAPSGKEEEVQDLLLDYGIDRSQLTVQCFNGSREQLAQLFCEVDLAIMPSRTEGFGLAALEALSAGLPVLVSGNSGLGQALKKVQYGSSCVVDSEDPKDWASAIKVVRHKDREIRLFESKILRETYAKMYNWKGQCNRLIETMLNITRGSLKAFQPLKKDKGPTLLQPWRHTIPQVDESSGRSPTHHSEANEFLGKQVSGTHRCQPLKSSVCLENLDVIHPLCYPHDKFDHVDVGLCLLECLLNHSRSVSHGEKRLDSYGPLSADVVECGSDIPNYSSLSSSIFSSCASSSLNSMPTTPSTFPLADYNLFESTKSTCEGLSSVDKLKECKAGPSSDVICLCESREHLCDNPLRITKCSRLSVNLPKEPSLSVDACAFSQSSYEECLNVEQSCCHLETQETKQSKTFTVKNISGAEEVLISSTDQKAALQNISSKDKDSSIGNASKLLTTQCVEDLCANQSLKLEESHQSIQGPLSGAHSDKVDTGTVTEDFFRTLLANLEDELAASQRDHHDLEQQIRKLEEKLKQSEEEKRELQADLGRYLFLEEKEKRRGRLLGGATAVQEPGLSMRSRLLEISDSLSSAEVKKIKFLLKSKVNGFRLARMREAFELFEELETNGLFSLNYVGQLLGEIQRYDLVEKLGIHGPLPRTRKGSNSSVESDHGSNSAKSTPVQDNISDEQTDGPEMEIQMDYAPSSKNYCELTSSDENGTSLRAEETDHDQSQCSSIFSSGSSVEEDSDIRLSSKSVENVVLVEESPKSPIPSDVMSLSNSSCCSSDLVANSHKTTPAISNNTLQASFEVDGFQVMSDGSQSASGYSNLSPTTWDTQGISHLMARPGNEPADKDGQLQGACAGGGKERQVKSHDFCDGTAMVVPYSTKIITECTKTDSSVSSDSGLARTQTIADGGGVSSTQQHVISDGEREITSPSPDATDWQRLGARPKESQRIVVEQVPTEPVVYITDGLAGDFLARHTQDKSLHDSIYKTDGASLFNDIPSQGTSFIDGDISQSSRAQAYVGDCHVASRAEPFIGTGNSLVSGSNRHLGGLYNAELFSDNSGLWSSRLGNDLFSLHSNFLSRNTSTAANNYSLQSDFVHNSSGFAGFHHFDEQTYLSSAPQAPYPPISSDDPVLNRYPGMSGSRFANPSWTDAALTLPGDPVHNAPRFNSFSSEQLTDPAQGASGFTGDDDASAFISNQGSDELAQAQKPNLALGNSRTTTGNIDDDANSAARYQFGNSTTFDGVLAARSTHDTSVLEPRLGDTDNSRVSLLNNTDFGTDSIEASDNSLLALERRVAEACALVERVLREREEREQFGKEIERKEQLIREQRARERREREERELREAENWPQEQEAITARSQWLCEHYQRHCRVRFPCCTQFYPCHRCHNISKACDNEEAKACHATHLKCSHCQHEQEIGEDSAKCRKCGGKMSAYFCAICKHFTSVDKNPYHCEKCGICRIHQDKSFHCEVCNVCLDKRLEGNHKCRPDSGHDECCICLEDAFSGCQILPCSHKVHRECAIAMIQNGIRTCPICRHPLYSQSSRG